MESAQGLCVGKEDVFRTQPIDKMTISYLARCLPVDIEFQQLTYSVPTSNKDSKELLHSINGHFKSGQLTAIMGPSGSGKSTLLNILAAYKLAGSGGNVFVNGEQRNVSNFRKMSRYILQEDVLQPMLTVEELMHFAADLKLANANNQEQKATIINEILSILSLTKAKHTRTERLSGGEKKRLSIALELINNPPVIFLDEPTTGLDELSSYHCIQLLKTLAEGGRTIICSIHTPSAKLFSTFDQVYVLANGYCTYHGYGPDIVPFLRDIGLECPKHFNPADFIIEVCNGDYGDHMQSLRRASIKGHTLAYHKRNILENGIGIYENQSDTMTIHRSSVLSQLRILLARMWLQMYRDKSYMCMRFVVTIFLALVIGNLFLGMGNDGSKTLFIFGMFYMCAILYLYIPMMPILLSFPTEMKIIRRETFNKWYQLTPYFIALTISTIPITLVLGMIFIPIIFVLSSQPMDLDRMAQFYGICMMTALVAESIGLIISSHLKIANAVFLGPVTAVPLMLLAVHGIGYGADAKIPFFMEVIMHFSFLRYSLEGLMASMMTNRDDLDCPGDEIICYFRNPEMFSKFMNVPTNNYWLDLAVLSGMYVFFRCVCFYMIQQRLRPNKVMRTIKFLLHTLFVQMN